MLSGWLVSSCTKSNDDASASITAFLTGGRVWRLASMQVYHYNGDTLKRTDTLNTKCTLNQTFYFETDGSCTYTNYSCISQSKGGKWTMTTQDTLQLKADVLLDTSSTGSYRPFANTAILNLGQNSLILQSTQTDTLFTTPRVVLRRKITRFGFIH